MREADGYQTLVALALDLKIRWATDNARSLDDVLRQMYNGPSTGPKRFTSESLRAFIGKVAGEDLGDFFGRYVAGSERLDIEGLLGYAGLKLQFGKREYSQDVGIFFNSNNSEVVALLPSGAGAASGLRPGDKILAIDGIGLKAGSLDKALENYAIGSSYDLRVLRDGQELDLKMKIAALEEPVVQVVEAETATDKQKKVREGLLSRPLRPEPARASARSSAGASSPQRLPAGLAGAGRVTAGAPMPAYR